jgi:hypothetical protein
MDQPLILRGDHASKRALAKAETKNSVLRRLEKGIHWFCGRLHLRVWSNKNRRRSRSSANRRRQRRSSPGWRKSYHCHRASERLRGRCYAGAVQKVKLVRRQTAHGVVTRMTNPLVI